MGSLPPDSTREEHPLLKATSDASGPDRARARAAYASRALALLDERDSYIARRVDTTLDEDQTGLLFVGAAHHVEKKLPRDIMLRRFDT
jgi:hypothetical protein